MVYSKKNITASVSSESELRKIIPSYPKMLDKRIIDHLDHYCLEIINNAAIIVLGTSCTTTNMSVLAKTDIDIIDTQTIRLSTANIAKENSDQQFASLYFLIPGVGHGLRVNGKLLFKDHDTYLQINGAYVHCARAAVRAELWGHYETKKISELKPNVSPQTFIDHSTFLMLKTMNEKSLTELSPRGDQAGFVRLLDENTLFIPERPGNKVAVSLRNILKNSSVEILMIIPRSNLVLRARGRAELTVDDELLNASSVNNKKPKIGIVVRDCRFEISMNPSLSAAWLEKNTVEELKLTKFSKVLSEHMNGKGILGKATTPVVQAIVKHDLNNLY